MSRLELLLLNLKHLFELHSLLRLELIELVVETHVRLPQLSYHINKVPILLHNVLVLILVANRSCLLPFPQHFDAVLKITLLRHVLLLDVLVDHGTLDLLVLHEIVQLLVNRLLQLLMVVGVLHDPVHRILLLINQVVVLADYDAELGNLVSHCLLLYAKVVDLEA